jgi:hypothetical protein
MPCWENFFQPPAAKVGAPPRSKILAVPKKEIAPPRAYSVCRARQIGSKKSKEWKKANPPLNTSVTYLDNWSAQPPTAAGRRAGMVG